jgi:hypothetical protein
MAAAIDDSTELLLLDPWGNVRPGGKRAAVASVRHVTGREGVRAAYRNSSGGLVWIAPSGGWEEWLHGVRPRPGRAPTLLAYDCLPEPRQALLRAFFPRLFTSAELTLLELAQLTDLLGSADRGDRFIGGVVSSEDGAVVLYRGDFTPLVVPMDWFTPTANGARPDFGDFEVVDYGSAVRLGPYEASASSILFEFDPKFRRARNQQRRAEDRTFGGSLRRLRLVRGLRQSDFKPLTEEQIRRLESGRTRKPRRQTLAILARRLDVAAERIGEY